MTIVFGLNPLMVPADVVVVVVVVELAIELLL